MEANTLAPLGVTTLLAKLRRSDMFVDEIESSMQSSVGAICL